MSILAAILLALIAGITEVLPVSGTGHLFLFAKLFGISAAGAEFQTFRGVLYLGVSFGLLLYYRMQAADIVRENLILLGLLRPSVQHRAESFGRRLGMLLFFAALPMLPALLLNGLRTRLEQGSGALAAVSVLLCISGALLYFASRGARGKRSIHQATLSDAVYAGLFQIPTVLPGFSRSGFTLAAFLSRGMEGTAAAELSGLMGVPVFLGAGLVQLIYAASLEGGSPGTAYLFLGFALATLSAFFTIRIFTEWMSRHKPVGFAYWSWGAGILSLILFLLSA